MVAETQIGERYVAVSKVRAMIRAEIKRFSTDVLEPAIGHAVGELVRECERRCTAKVTTLESAMSEFAYRGQWTEGKQYRRGNFVTLGSVWHANVDTQSKPGTDSTWACAIARPRDGRDGNGTAPPSPPEPPARRTVTSQRSQR